MDYASLLRLKVIQHMSGPFFLWLVIFRVRFGDLRELINPNFAVATQQFSDVLDPLDPIADDLPRRLA